MLSSFLQGWRSWKTARGVAVLAIAALAVGIGSTTAIYCVTHAVLLKPLPYENPDRFYYAFGAFRPNPDLWTSVSYPDYLDYARRARYLDAFGCYDTGAFNVSLGKEPVYVTGTETSSAIAESFGVKPLIGRWFKDNEAGSPYLAVISTSLWKRFGSDPNILGRQLTISGARYTVTGVMPGWFRYPVDERDNDIWVPLNPTDNQKKYRAYHYLRCIAKLKPGETRAEGTADLTSVLESLRREHPANEGEPDLIRLYRVLDLVVQEIRPSLLLLLGAAIALLIVACANVASMLLARSVSRVRETGVRVALGATMLQLGTQYFAEGLLVSLGGAVLGSLLALALVQAVLSIAADEIPRADEISFNWAVLGFCVAVAVSCGVFFSLSPLWQAKRITPNEALAESTRGSASARSRKILSGFVIAQVALAFTLLALGGALYAHLTGLYTVNPGFDPEHLTIFQMRAPATRYKDQTLENYETRLLSEIQNVPSIEGAGFTELMPLVDTGENTWVQVEGRPARDWKAGPVIEQRFVSPSYFQAMKIPLIRGRFFNDNDKDTGQKGAILPMLINQTLARLYWPNSDPIGSVVRSFSSQERRFQVVGVVGDVRNYGLGQPPHPEFYLTYREVTPHTMMWAVRSPVPTADLAGAVRKAVWRIDPEQAIFDLKPMDSIVYSSVSRQRLQSMIVSFFAGAALLLASLGIYGAVAYSVRQRLMELGTRMAIGAAPRDLLRLVVGDGARMAAIGIAIGLILTFATAQVLARTALRVEIGGPGPFIAAACLVIACVLLACGIPAWRASAVSPMAAIRTDVQPLAIDWRSSYRALFERASEKRVTLAGPTASSELLAALAEVSREAQSFTEALETALNRICADLGASSAVLFTRREAGKAYRVAAATEGVNRDLSLPPDSLLLRRLTHYATALPISKGDLDALKRWANEHATARLVEIETLTELGTALAAAVVSKSEIVGTVILGPPRSAQQYTPSEARDLRAASAQIALLIENGWLMERILEQERLRRELMLAAEVQKRLFPEGTPQTEAIQLAGMCMPARGVGGDYYDFLEIGNGRIGIALADVAGKGIAAALIMSVVQASLRSLAEADGASPADLAGRMNRLLHRSTGANSYATFFYAQFDEQQKRLQYVNAGHNPPFLLRANGSGPAQIEELSAGGMIIGMFAQSTYEDASIDLQSGDTMLLFSDGVSEAHNPAEDEFGEDRLKDLLRRTAHLPINEMARQIMSELKTWMSDAPQHDDLTFVLMKVV